MADERSDYTDRVLDTEFRVVRDEQARLSKVVNGLPADLAQVKSDLHYVKQDCADMKAMVKGDQPTKMRRGDWISIGLFLCAAAGTVTAIISGAG